MKTTKLLFTVLISLLVFTNSCNENPLGNSNKKGWYKQASITDESINDIFFINESEGWLTTFFSIMHTSNGGNDWSTISEKRGGGIYFINNLTGWLDGYPNPYKTKDGGKNWEIDQDLIKIKSAIKFFENVGYCMSQDYLFKSTNYGFSWEKSPLPKEVSNNPTSMSVGHCFFIDKNNIYFLVGYTNNCYLYKTSNGGITWDRNEFTFNFDTMIFLDVNTGFISLYGYIYKTIDGGITWKYCEGSGMVRIFQIFFFNKQYGWSFGIGDGKYKINHTNDGGKTWIEQNSGIDDDIDINDERFTTIFFINQNKGWIGGGKYGTILHTSNGGNK